MYKNYKIVFLFSGQGSHYRGMGQKLYEQNEVFRKSLEQSDYIIQKYLHRSIVDELYHKKQLDFDDLLITHPAIVAIETAMYTTLRSIGIQPDYVLGNSLGEFTSAFVKGVWTAQAALEAAIQQAVSITSNAKKGGMLAVIHSKTSELQNLYNKYNLFLASDNFDGHFTVSGLSQNLDIFQKELENRNMQFLRLPVAYAFHSPLIDEGHEGFNNYMNHTASLSKPAPGFISGIFGKEVHTLPINYFWQVVTQYSNFNNVVQYMEEKGPCLYIDLGPSGTSATFVKYNLPSTTVSKTFQIMTPFKREVEQLKSLQEFVNNLLV